MDAITKPQGAYHHGTLRRALVDAAIELVTQEGVAALSLRAVARRAGVSTAAPYRHFPSRAGLLAAVAREGFDALSEAIRIATAELDRDDPLARFRESGVAYVHFAQAHPAHYCVMFAPELLDRSAWPELQVAARRSMTILLDAISDCQAAGLVRAGDPVAHAVVAWASTHGLASLITSGQIAVLGPHYADIDTLARIAADGVLQGLCVRP